MYIDGRTAALFHLRDPAYGYCAQSYGGCIAAVFVPFVPWDLDATKPCLPDFERLYAYVGYEYCCCSSEIVEVLCTPELFLFPRNMEKKHGKQGNDLYSNESTS